MATRTYSALGHGWQTWIDLDGSGKAGIVLTRMSGPHAYVDDAAQAQDVFGVMRGPAIDNMPGQEHTRAFVQEFPTAELSRIKIVSAQAYAADFERAAKRKTDEEAAGADTKPIDVPKPTPPKASRRKAAASA